jgi:parallel beta-helix repeat protein
MPLEITLEVGTPKPVDVITSVMRGPAGPTGLSGAALIHFDVVTDYAPAGTLRNGTVDWRPYIQAAIDACNAAGGGVVWLREGTYLVGYGIHVKSNVWLRGAGIGATTIKLADNSTPSAEDILKHLGNVISLFQAIKGRVSDLSIDGNRTNNTEAVASINAASYRGGIRVGDELGNAGSVSRDCLLHDLHVTEAAAEGIIVQSTRGCWVRDCYSDDHGAPISNWNSFAIIISTYASDCHIVDCVGGFTCLHGGIEIYSPTLPVPSINASGLENTIERCRTSNITVNTAGNTLTNLYTRIVDNDVNTEAYEDIGSGIIIVACPANLIISGNTVRHTEGYGIVLTATLTGRAAGDDLNGRRVILSNNLIERVPREYAGGGAGIAVQGGCDLVVSGNHISGSGGGIYLTKCINASVVGNTLLGMYDTVDNYVAPNDGSRESPNPMDATKHPRYGIYIVESRDCVFSANCVRGYNWSALVEDAGVASESKVSARNTIIGNNFFNNYYSELSANNRAPTSVWEHNILRP